MPLCTFRKLGVNARCAGMPTATLCQTGLQNSSGFAGAPVGCIRPTGVAERQAVEGVTSSGCAAPVAIEDGNRCHPAIRLSGYASCQAALC